MDLLSSFQLHHHHIFLRRRSSSSCLFRWWSASSCSPSTGFSSSSSYWNIGWCLVFILMMLTSYSAPWSACEGDFSKSPVIFQLSPCPDMMMMLPRYSEGVILWVVWPDLLFLTGRRHHHHISSCHRIACEGHHVFFLHDISPGWYFYHRVILVMIILMMYLKSSKCDPIFTRVIIFWTSGWS